MLATIYHVADPKRLVQSIRSHPLFRYVEFSTDTITQPDLKIPPQQPELYVGRALTEKRLGISLDLLNTQVGPWRWWVPSAEESLTYHLRGLEEFFAQIGQWILSLVTWQVVDARLTNLTDLPAWVTSLGPLFVYEHYQGFSFCQLSQPQLVYGLQADVWYYHRGLYRETIREALLAQAVRSYREGESEQSLSGWIETRLELDPVLARRIAPWLLARREATGKL
jgi:hypothetical protein